VLKINFFLFLVLQYLNVFSQIEKTQVAGVYQGKTLFVQNPYDPKSRTFCVETIQLNGRDIPFDIKSSAIKLDFNGVDQYAPVHILIVHKDYCQPIIINPDAIDFHSVFSISEVEFRDSVFVWKTKGEEADYSYFIEKYDLGIWKEIIRVEAQGVFAGAVYEKYPKLDVGANKLRVRCELNNGAYLFSNEVDFHFYPDPVTFRPFATEKILTFSRTANFEIFDAGGSLVLSGQNNQVDVSELPRGDYVIYFDGEDPGMFQRK